MLVCFCHITVGRNGRGHSSPKSRWVLYAFDLAELCMPAAWWCRSAGPCPSRALTHHIPVCSRSLGSSAPLMEEILRWGTQDLFQARRDSEGNTAVQSREADVPSAMEGVEGGASLRDDAGNSDGGRPVKAAQVRISSTRNHRCAERGCAVHPSLQLGPSIACDAHAIHLSASLVLAGLYDCWDA